MKYLYRISLTFMILTIFSALVLGGLYLHRRGNHTVENESAQEITETAYRENKTDCDTEYIILEQDIKTGESTTDVLTIPAKYIGKSKEQLISLLSQEEKSPPLKEREKGLTSIRLSAFSSERVVIVKTYESEEKEEEAVETLQGTKQSVDAQTNMIHDGYDGTVSDAALPENVEVSDAGGKGGPYYLMVYAGKIWVYYEDLKTVYLATDISIERLPEDVKQEVLDKKYVKNEEELYNFLESYSS